MIPYVKPKKRVKQEPVSIENPTVLDQRIPPPAKMVEAYTSLMAQELPDAPPLEKLRADFKAMSILEQHQKLRDIWDLVQEMVSKRAQPSKRTTNTMTN
jgi:hypothetical protein